MDIFSELIERALKYDSLKLQAEKLAEQVGLELIPFGESTLSE